ncbi:MAG TPA: DUF3108 domain-containing protein [Verrucomicrobiae bacterium]|nr:DUF3108 domain-containing protein [Verrucomicrobiae bacterium]
MHRRWICVLLAAACGLFAARATRAEDPAPALPLGEKLHYKITWLGIPVGTGELRVEEKTTLDGREVYHAVGFIETNRILRKIFPMHDEAESWIDAVTLESLQFEKKIDELILNTHEKMTFDAPRRKGRFESLKSGETQEFDIPAAAHDVISAAFWARRQELAPDRPARTVLIADRKEWELELDTVGVETIKWQGKKVEVLRVDPVTRVGGEEKRGRASFYLTLDAARKPLRIVFKAPFGSVVGTLEPEKG